MSELTVKYEDGLYADLRDPAEAAAYLSAAVEDGDQQLFMMALRDVVNARGIAEVAGMSGLNRENMYRMLSASGNPQLSSLMSLLHSMGLRLVFEVDKMQPAPPHFGEAVMAERSEPYNTERAEP